ncbi:EamA family transporter [Corynebacterium propinquum]|uniref:EamA family transporter n=1 Tax=Corynebacterium propinquum TaxID=43769 RepID=UPI003B6379EF
MASSANPISVLCIIGSCISLQLGSALAVKLFDDGGTWGTSAVRLLVAAVVLLAITRPRVHEWNRQQWAGVLGLGLSLGLMNGFFYAGIDLVPLGPAVTIEFLGPLLLAAFLSRSLRDGICVILAMTGMALLGLDAFNGNPLNPLGVAFLLGQPCSGPFISWRIKTPVRWYLARAGWPWRSSSAASRCYRWALAAHGTW